jgi:hypothetical protein
MVRDTRASSAQEEQLAPAEVERQFLSALLNNCFLEERICYLTAFPAMLVNRRRIYFDPFVLE